MFRNSFQSGFLSILYSIGSKPLQLWDVQAKDGFIESVRDEELDSKVLEVKGANVVTTFISCPQDAAKTLGIKLPWLVLLVKNMDEQFSLESTTRVAPNICTMPLKLEPGWNEVRFDMADFCRRAYGTELSEISRVTIHATCRLRRVYFTDKAYREDELPSEFKLFKVQRHAAPAAEGADGPPEGSEDS